MNKLVRKWFVAGAMAVSMMVLPSAVQAAPVYFGFEDITSTSGAGGAAIDQQMWVGVDSWSGGVEFVFYNVGPLPSTIEQINWDDSGGLLSTCCTFNYIIPPTETNKVLSFDDSNNTFPQWNDIPAAKGGAFDEDFGVAALPPPSKNGIDPGEVLGVRFALSATKTVTDVVDALVSGAMRIGLHVISIGTGATSDSLLNTPLKSGQLPNPVPLPAAGFLLLAALGTLGFVRRFRRVIG